MDQELCAAIKIGELEKVKYLVSLGADIRGKNDHSVKLASSYGHLHMVILKWLNTLFLLELIFGVKMIYLLDWLLEMVI